MCACACACACVRVQVVRMAKLLRVARLSARVDHLLNRPGLAPFATAIGIARALFILLFVAHAYGCFFTMLADAADGPPGGWLAAYRAGEVADAGTLDRYRI